MAAPEVTVLMTVRNGEPYLREAVASILDQTYRDFRFLILDNASTDDSRQVIRDFGDQRIDLVELPEDIGPPAALNRGLDMVDTAWVARMDADDVSLSRRLELQMAYLADHPDVVLLGTWLDVIDEKGDRCGGYRLPIDRSGIWDQFLVDNAFAHSSVVFRVARVRQLGGYPEDCRVGHDAILWLSLSNRYEVANLPEVLVQIRRHGGQTTHSASMSKAARRDRLRVYRTAQAHGGQTAQARRAGRRAMASAMLDYADVLAGEGHRREALRWATEAVVRYPLLCATDIHIRARAVRVFLGRRTSGFLRNVKHRLFRASATR